VDYASRQGYPTLAIDRLGNGLSDHPDPVAVVQMPAHAEVANGLVQLARDGAAPLPRAFDKIIYVGHSFGSVIGNLFNAKYPHAVEATILTGYSSDFILSGIHTSLSLVPLPAEIVDPTTWNGLPPGYLESTSESGDVAAFFYEGWYDPALQALDYERRGTLTIGEALTFPLSTTEAPNYTSPVLVVSGQRDRIFCNPTVSILTPDCGTGPTNMLASSRSLYPAASIYGWHVVPDAGHCWQLHYTAQDGFNASHAWLAGLGF
jgi:pimeloyl-ACP methyl ester carboxylesterase